MIEQQGGVTLATGFLAGAIHCGIKPGNLDRDDMAMIYSELPCVGAATFTTNKIKAAPVKVSQANLRSPETRAIVVNSGNANACTGLPGVQSAKLMVKRTAKSLGLREREIQVCSTGRIGVQLPIEKMEAAIKDLSGRLSSDGSSAVAKAIMTSDTVPKEFAVQFEVDGKTVSVGGVAKGAGMIDPNMATMLSFITTDANFEKKELQKVLGNAVEQSFNRITIDGDMSTNDTVVLLANGGAELPVFKPGDTGYTLFIQALNLVTRNLARMIVEDGEGVTRFVEVQVIGAATYQDARKAAEAIANSTLVKCAWFGGDPNWGRIVDAIGYSTAKVREEMLDVYYDGLIAVQNGMASNTPFEELCKVVANARFTVTVNLHLGSAEYIVFTTDLTTEYVDFNKGE